MKKMNLTTNLKYMDVTDEVCKELQKRAKFGEKKYGTRLKPFNGRNALQDLFEELLDASCYIKQKLIEDENRKVQ